MLSRIWLRVVTTTSVLALSGLSVSWAADIVYKKDGSKVGGSITSMTKSDITVKPTSGDPQTVPQNEIRSVEWDNTPAAVKIAYRDLENGRFDRALDELNKLKGDAKISENLGKDIGYAIARARTGKAKASPAAIDEAIKEIKAAQTAAPDFYLYYPSLVNLGEMYLAKNDFANARVAFDQFESASNPAIKQLGQIYIGRLQLAEGKVDDAIKTYDDVIAAAGDDPAQQTRKFEAQMGKARALLQKGAYKDALPILDGAVDKISPSDLAVAAECRLLQGNCYQALSQNRDAVLSYLYVDLNYPTESDSRAEALYHLSRLWKTVQHPERGLEARARLESDYPDSTWTRKLAGGEAS